jgi:preprotein translocase subunit SecB
MQIIPLSPLELKFHFFTHVSVLANPTGTATGQTSLEPVISSQKNPQNERQWHLGLRVVMKSTDPEKPFVYDTDVAVQGMVEVHETFPADKREQLAEVNGYSLLYSAIREMLLTVTGRSSNGLMCLPTLNFVEIVANKETQGKLKEGAIATTPSPAPVQK